MSILSLQRFNHPSVYRALSVAIVVMIAFLVPTKQAAASNISTLGAIDAIDHVFAAGGGVASGTFSSGIDDDWIVFAANFGDVITINGSNLGTGGWINGVLLQDIGDGNFQIGDIVGITNFNNNNIGLGFPLQILNTNSSWGHGGCASSNESYALSTNSCGGILTFVAGYTGQYGLGLAVNNSADSQAGSWQVTLSGNTRNVVGVPEPTTLVLLGIGLVGLGFSRRKRL